MDSLNLRVSKVLKPYCPIISHPRTIFTIFPVHLSSNFCLEQKDERTTQEELPLATRINRIGTFRAFYPLIFILCAHLLNGHSNLSSLINCCLQRLLELTPNATIITQSCLPTPSILQTRTNNHQISGSGSLVNVTYNN